MTKAKPTAKEILQRFSKGYSPSVGEDRPALRQDQMDALWKTAKSADPASNFINTQAPCR